MTRIFGQAAETWRLAARTIWARPLPFLIAAALLTGTDLLAWKMGALDGVPAPDLDKALLATFLFGKLAVTLGWVVAGLRLLDGRTSGLLKLGRRQLLWLGGFFLLLPVLLLFRVLIQRVMGTALAPAGADPRTILLLSVAVYLAIFLYVQVRLIPALVGVLLDNGEAGLAWAWRGTRGQALFFIGGLVLAAIPLFLLHFGNSLVWLPKASAARLAVLALDGATMAALLLVSCAAYLGLYRRALPMAEVAGSRHDPDIGAQPSA